MLRRYRGKVLGPLILVGALGVLWHVLPPQPQYTLKMLEKSTLVGLTPGGQNLVTIGTGNGTLTGPIRVWDVATGNNRTIFDHLAAPIVPIILSPAGSYLAALANRKPPTSRRELCVLNVATGDEIFRHSAAGRFAFSKDGKMLAFLDSLAGIDPDNSTEKVPRQISNEYRIVVWDLAARRERLVQRVIWAQKAAFFPLTFDPTGRLLATGYSTDAELVKVWEVATGREVATMANVGDEVHLLAFDKTGTKLTALGVEYNPPINESTEEHRVSQGDKLKEAVWDAATGKELARREMRVISHEVPLVPGSRLPPFYLRGGGSSHVSLVDAITGTEQAALEVRFGTWWGGGSLGLNGQITSDGKLLALRRFVGPNRIMEALSQWFPSYVSPARDREPEICLFDASNGEVVGRVPGNDFHLTADGKRLATMRTSGWTGSADDKVAIWHIPPRKPLGPFAAISAAMACVYALILWRSARSHRRAE
jgi:WD40 repeat protein